MTDTNTYHFVWVQGMRGPTPEKWSEPNMMREGVKIATLAKHPITAEEWEHASCADLAVKYPAPRAREVAA